MGSIIERRRKDGSVALLAQVVIKHKGRIVRRENKTFTDLRQAKAWMAVRETDRDEAADDPKLATVIDRYLADSRREPGRTKTQVLTSIKAMPIAKMRCSRIKSSDLVAMAETLLKGRRQPQTVHNYLSHLGSIFAIARPAWGFPLDERAVLDAMKVSKRLGFTARSRERDRRPTVDELVKLLDHFDRSRARRRDSTPMADIVLFAIFSTRRLEEICRVRWADLDVQHSRLMVRDMKHPGEKIGNDQWLDLPPEAMAVVQRQPRDGDRIFPAGGDTVSTAFTRACKLLGIEDLHFHDLRHDGISRLFELGWSIPHVAAVSGHRSWSSLKRYTHIRQRGDKYAGTVVIARTAG